MIMIEQLDELREENDFLKKELKCNKQLRGRLQNELMKSDREVEKLKEKTKKLETCLQEIKEIATGRTDLCEKCEQYNCKDICDAYRLDKILQKIAE